MSMTKETIAKITKASGVSAGELILVHFWGEDTDKEIADYFAASVAALGATPLVLQQARSINRDIFSPQRKAAMMTATLTCSQNLTPCWMCLHTSLLYWDIR